MSRLNSSTYLVAAAIAVGLLWELEATAGPQTLLPASIRPASGTPIPFWRLDIPQTSGLEKPMQEVISSEERFVEIWRKMHSTHIYENYIRAPKPPPVDFSKEVVVLLAMGQRSTGGYAIRAGRIVHGPGRVEIIVTRSAPGEKCAVTQSITAPVDILRMEVPVQPVAFLVHEITDECR